MSQLPGLLEQFDAPVTSMLHGSRLHYWPAPGGKPSATLLFIPGNPGLADYYLVYLTALHRTVNIKEGGSLEIFCPSQLGHDPLSTTMPPTLMSLDQQVQHKAEVLETITTQRGDNGQRKRVFLSGHSIGAWMALEIVRRGLNKVPVHSIHLLFPAVHQLGQTPNAKQLSWLLKSNPPSQQHVSGTLVITILSAFITIALAIIRNLPLPLVQFVVLLGAPSQPPSVVRTTTGFLLTPPCVQQALSMGKEEMQLVRDVQDLPMKDGRRMNTKLRAYWAAGDLDSWAPEKTRKAVENVLGLEKYELPDDIIDKSAPMPPLQKKKSFSIDEIRKARLSKRRAIASAVRAGASASYGLASSLGQLGYRRQRPPPVSRSNAERQQSAAMRRRRPSLLAARASRRFDGSIYIEPTTDDSLEDYLLKDANVADGVVFESPTVELDENEVTAKNKLHMPSRASIVCRQGFKHAFVLEHSEQMASISAAMLMADMSD